MQIKKPGTKVQVQLLGERTIRPALIEGAQDKDGELTYNITMLDTTDAFEASRWCYADQIR